MAEFDRYAPWSAVAPKVEESNTPAAETVPKEETSGNVTVKWNEPAATAGAALAGAGASALASRAFPVETPDRKVAGTQAKLDLIREMQQAANAELEAKRAPYLAEKSALTTASEAAAMELKRNEMLMQAVTKRAMELGVDPRVVLSSPETFQRAMAPQRGFGTTNWLAQEYPHLNPIVEKDIKTKGMAKPVVEGHLATAPLAQQVVGTTVERPSGLYTPARTGAEQTTAGSTLANVENSYLKAVEAEKQAAAAAKAAPEMPTFPEEKRISSLSAKEIAEELKLRQQMAELAARPGIVDRLALALSGPKASAGFGALGALDLMNVPEYYQKGEYQKALLSAMGGLGALGLASPNPYIKLGGIAASTVPFAYEYGPKLFESARKGYNALFPPPKK